jgi:hypothetical protein
VPKRLAILGVLLFALIAAVTVLPRRGQVFSAGARVAATAPQATQAPPVATPSATPSAKHSIRVKFDYDFSRSPVCSAKVTSKCVRQFNVYDVSGGPQHRVKLFSVPVPAGASGQMKGITATSPQLVFEPGTHFFAVTAQPTAGDESNPVACQTTARINP